MKKLYVVLILPVFMISCSNIPIKRGSVTSMDRTERCMYRLVERNGVNASEAQKVCDNVFRNRLDNIGIRR